MYSNKPRLAIIGTGIAGLGAAYFLNRHYAITLFEKNAYIGGHTNTVTVNNGSDSVAIDTGFMVFNPVTYPNLCRLFQRLGIASQATDMSFSVQNHATKTEWAGASLNQLFGQRRNLVQQQHWKFLAELSRFNQQARHSLNDAELEHTTVAEFVRQYGYSQHFLDHYMLPMSSAIWSTDPQRMLHFPIRTLMRFYHNHGFLGMDTHYQWYTVTGGASTYIKPLLQQASISENALVRNASIRAVRMQSAQQASIVLEDGQELYFDKIIVATHADQALALLESPTSLQQRLLSPFRYEKNTATLHSDARVMPQRARLWAAWNYRLRKNEEGNLKPATHYWMNRLQQLPTQTPYFVSINDAEAIDPQSIHWQSTYEHPNLTPEAIKAQKQLQQLNTEETPLYFCGSYFRYGFHEDAFLSALKLSESVLNGANPWAQETISSITLLNTVQSQEALSS